MTDRGDFFSPAFAYFGESLRADSLETLPAEPAPARQQATEPTPAPQPAADVSRPAPARQQTDSLPRVRRERSADSLPRRERREERPLRDTTQTPSIDSLAALAADSLAAQPVDTLPEAPAFLPGTPAELFGEASQRGTARITGQKTEPVPPFSQTTTYQASTLLLAVGYCLVLYYFRPMVFELGKVLRSKLYTEKLLDDAHYSMGLFLRLATALGLLALALFTVRGADLYFPAQWAVGLPGWAREAAVPLVAVGLALTVLLRAGVMALAGGLTLSGEFCDRLTYLRRLSGALLVAVLTPLLLLSALDCGMLRYVTFWMVAAGAFAAFAVMLYKSYILFAEQNFSISLWILYLCAVEIFPVSLLALLLVKNT